MNTREENIYAVEQLIVRIGSFPSDPVTKEIYCTGVKAFQELFPESKQGCCPECAAHRCEVLSTKNEVRGAGYDVLWAEYEVLRTKYLALGGRL